MFLNPHVDLALTDETARAYEAADEQGQRDMANRLLADHIELADRAADDVPLLGLGVQLRGQAGCLTSRPPPAGSGLIDHLTPGCGHRHLHLTSRRDKATGPRGGHSLRRTPASCSTPLTSAAVSPVIATSASKLRKVGSTETCALSSSSKASLA